MLLSVIVMAAALAGGEPAASAPAPAATVTPVTAPAPKPKKKLVCVEEQQMGSLFKQKICATPEEWEKRRVRDQEAMARSAAR